MTIKTQDWTKTTEDDYKPWRPDCPCSPFSPLGPVKPVAPVGPRDPGCPVNPCWPRSPARPSGPGSPTRPGPPGSPVSPVKPVHSQYHSVKQHCSGMVSAKCTSYTSSLQHKTFSDRQFLAVYHTAWPTDRNLHKKASSESCLNQNIQVYQLRLREKLPNYEVIP